MITNALSTYTRHLAIIILLVIPMSAQAAFDMFLRIGDIQGEAVDDVYNGWIEIHSLNEGMTQSATMHTGTGGSAGKVNVSDITVTKFLDSSSPEIRLRVANGKHFDKAEIILRKTGDIPLEFFKIELTDVLISSVSMSGSGFSEERPTENVTLNFGKIKWTYTPEKADGSGDASIVRAFNIVLNVEE